MAMHQRQTSSAEAAMAQAGLYYYDFDISGSAKVLNGNTVATGWYGQVLDAPQTYKKIKISAQPKVLNGNMYGGGDFFGA